MGKLLPILLAVMGTGLGVGAGLFLTPEDGEEHAEPAECAAPEKQPDAPMAAVADEEPQGEQEYVKLNNQFVVPIMGDNRVKAVIVASLGVELSQGNAELVYSREPKLRDALLQVLFDHANIGGFDGAFTEGQRMLALRAALRDAARPILGDAVHDILITEIGRQDN